MAHFKLQTAEDDLKAAGALLDAGLPAHACFAAQQCGEKAVEALWYLAGADPWGHCIVELVAKLPQRDDISAIATWMEKAEGLDKFYNGIRSSTGLPDLTPGRVYLRAEAERAIEMARFLLDAASSIVAVEEATPLDSSDRDETELFGPYVSSLERIGRWLGQLQLVLRVLSKRFDAVPPDLELRIRGLPGPQLPSLMDVALTAESLSEVATAVEALPAGADN